MRLSVRECANAQQEMAAANYPEIRLFWVPDADSTEPQFTVKASWRACSPKTVGTFSGAAYYFGRELHKVLGVPVGLIDTSRGWSPIEAWLPMDLMEKEPAVTPLIDRHRQLAPKLDLMEKEYQQQLAAWKGQQAAATRQATQPADPATTQPSSPRPRRVWGVDPRLRPEGLYNAMLVPLAPYPLAGVVWYQGESNVLRAEQYRVMLPMLIAHWRKIFGRSDLPFGIVQLPQHINGEIPFDSSWAELRESQLLTYRNTPNTGLAITIDIGEPRNIHPFNKQDVGKRLAMWALVDVYGKQGETTGPLFRSYSIAGNSTRIEFDHVGKGLVVGADPLKGFTIAGPDRKFHPADARIEGQSVVVSSPAVANPVAVRYAWEDNPACSLRNGDGLPASPFRTDTWPLLTAGVLTTEWQ
jgi:sialate O-acetylesterase